VIVMVFSILLQIPIGLLLATFLDVPAGKSSTPSRQSGFSLT